VKKQKTGLDIADTNKDQLIDFDEFTAFLMKMYHQQFNNTSHQGPTMETEAMRHFEFMDSNSDGKVTVAEFDAFLQSNVTEQDGQTKDE